MRNLVVPLFVVLAARVAIAGQPTAPPAQPESESAAVPAKKARVSSVSSDQAAAVGFVPIRDFEKRDTPEASAPTAGRRVLATSAALVPGIAFHGMGHLVRGDYTTAKRLFAWQAAGLAMAASGGTIVRYSGGSRYGNELTIPLLIGGVGLFLNTFVADVYGSATGGRPQLRYVEHPATKVALSYAYLQDPQFAYQNFSILDAEISTGRFVIAPRLWTALDANNQRARLPVRVDALLNDEGDRVSVIGAFTYHNFGDDLFATTLGEVGIEARTNLSRISETLSGTYTSMMVGYGLQRISYDAEEADTDYNGLLIARFSYGFYTPRGGALEGYYQHRRDNFTAGLSPGDGNGSGFLGQFGLSLRQPLSKRFAVLAGTEIGSAWLATAGLEISADGLF